MLMIYYPKRGCGGMADTGDLKSPAHKACGFESRQPHRKAPRVISVHGALFCIKQRSLFCFKREHKFGDGAELRTDPSDPAVFQPDPEPEAGRNIEDFIFSGS